MNGSFPGGSPGGVGAPGTRQPPPQVAQFFQDNAGLVAAIIVIALLVAVAWFLLSCVTAGALVRASAEHDAERPFGLGPAWRAGLGTFWPILALRLLGLAVGLVALVLVGLLALLGYLAYAGGQGGLLAVIVVVGVLFVIALIPFGILAGIVLILATRSAVLEQRRPIAALGRSLHLLGDRLGRTLLVWLIQLALSIGVGIAVLLVLGIVAALLGGLVLAAGLAAGQGAAVVVGVPVGLVLLAALILVGGVTGSYFSTYWTLAFRRLELDAPPQAAPGPPAAYPPQPTA
jgi:hypothetical protein